MSASRLVPILLLGLLALAALVHGLIGKKNQTFDGVIVQDFTTYEFYPNAKDCKYRGTPYVLLPNERFHEVVTASADIDHINRLLHGTWRAKLNGNLSALWWHKYRKNYWRELSVNYVIDAAEMSCGGSQLTPAEHKTVTVDWKAELAKAKAGIEKNPKSAFWHNQAGVAYNALGDFKSAVKEIKLAIALDASDPINYYTLYSVYQRNGMHSEQRQVLLDALERDPNNPLGRYEFAYILEDEKHWADSLREYQVAKRLVEGVTGSAYIDARGNAYTIEGVRGQVDKAIDRVGKLNETSNETYSPGSKDETEVLSVVLKSEFQANNWTKNERICFSVQGLDPSPELVKTLRQHLNVCSSAEWRKKFDCRFEVRIQYPSFELSQGRNIRAQIVDLREINQGIGDLAVIARDVEYSLHKSDGKWLVSDCVLRKDQIDCLAPGWSRNRTSCSQ